MTRLIGIFVGLGFTFVVLLAFVFGVINVISEGQLKKGDVALMAAFAHAGDFAGAAAIKWGGRD